MKKLMLSVGAATMVVAAATAPAWSAERAWHFDTSAIDRAANPGDSFFLYANGNWDRNTPIPADKPALSSFSVLQDQVNEQVRTVLEDAAKAAAPQGSAKQKVGDYYASFMDEAAIKARGGAPLKADLDSIAAAKGKADLAALFADAQRNNIPSPVSVGWGTDLRDSSRYMVTLNQGGLGLPSRDFYLDEANPRFAEIRTKYQDYVGNMLRLAGFSEPEARAKRVFELERKLAQAQWSTLELRQVEKTYNPMTAAEIAAAAPGLDWGAFLRGTGLSAEARLNVGQPSALTGTAALVASEPLETWQDYLRIRTIQRYSSVLPKAFVETNFDFYGKTLAGTPQLQERWKRAVNSANGSVGEGVGQLYVARYFPPEAKAKADRLVRNLISAMDKSSPP